VTPGFNKDSVRMKKKKKKVKIDVKIKREKRYKKIVTSYVTYPPICKENQDEM
jgi:hypothetical protein